MKIVFVFILIAFLGTNFAFSADLPKYDRDLFGSWSDEKHSVLTSVEEHFGKPEKAVIVQKP